MFTGIIEEMGEVVSLTPTEAGSAVLTLRAGAVLEGLPDGGSLAVNGVCLTQAPEAGSGTTSSASHSSDSAPATAASPSSPPSSSPPSSSPSSPAPPTPSASPTSSAPPSAKSLFVAHVMGETLTRTTVGALQPGDPVNLERCPRAGDRFDGHIVQGHIDGTGRVVERVDEGDWVRIRIAVPADLAPYTAEKGSIALDGVSLTLSAVSPAPGTDPTGTDPTGANPADTDPNGTDPTGAHPTGTDPNSTDPHDTDHWVEVSLIPATLAATRMGVLQVGDAVNIEVDIIAKYAARLTAFRTTNAAPTTDRGGPATSPTMNHGGPATSPTTTSATTASATADSSPAAPAAATPHEGDLS